MKKMVIIFGSAALLVTWWYAATPREEIRCCVGDSIVFDPSVVQATEAVDQSERFAAELEMLPLDLSAYDDALFLDNGKKAPVTAHDGKIWEVDFAANAAQPFVDVPLMAWGIHEAPGDPTQSYFCSAGSYGDRPAGEVAGNVPDTKKDQQHPVVYVDDDSDAPELQADGSSHPSRKIAVCDNLEVSEDGRRVYFSEPFSYKNSSADDAIDEAVALAPNGRLWRYDLEHGSTRLIAEGFHFINGVLYDLHPGQAREKSVVVTQTSLFRVTRFYLSGSKAGQYAVVIDSLPGMPGGMDRDAEGRIWLAMFTDRSPVLTWVHENAWIMPLVMRLPAALLLSQTQRTGVVVLSPDGSKPLYSAFYEGSKLSSIASVVPAPDGVYLANVALNSLDRSQRKGIQRLRWPMELTQPMT